MSQSKYVVIEDKGMIVFPKHLNHLDVAKSIIGPTKNVLDNVISAGFCQIGVNEKPEPTYHCYGKSVSMNKNSREEIDSNIFRRMFEDY